MNKEAERRSRNAHKRKCVVNGHGAQSIKSRRTESAIHVCRKAMRQTEQQNAVEQ